MKLQKHAYELAAWIKVRLIESDQLRPEEACAIPHLRVVLTGPITERLTYAVVLHELGHFGAATGVFEDRPRTLNVMRDEEHAAWAWARHYALEWTEDMEALAQWAENTYLAEPAAAPPRPAPAAPKPKKQQIDWNEWEKRR
jgi:hypothetical protein